MTDQEPASDLPEREPVMLAAFEGWNDAGSAASQTLELLDDVWGAEEIAALDPEEYHDFQVNRPTVTSGPTGRREITWPTTRIAVLTTPQSGRIVVLVHGIEPSMRWRRYCTELLDIAAGLGVDTVVTLGALLADVPHTRPIPVTTTAEGPGSRELAGVEPNSYEGPTGIVGILQHEAAARGFTGSPTFLINGTDPFGDSTQATGLTCRLYRQPNGPPSGLPGLNDLRDALVTAVRENRPRG